MYVFYKLKTKKLFHIPAQTSQEHTCLLLYSTKETTNIIYVSKSRKAESNSLLTGVWWRMKK